MQNTIILKITQSKNKTNYIPSIPLNQIKELSEYPNRTWHYHRRTNTIHLTFTSEPISKDMIHETNEPQQAIKSVSKNKKQKGKQQSRRDRKKGR